MCQESQWARLRTPWLRGSRFLVVSRGRDRDRPRPQPFTRGNPFIGSSIHSRKPVYRGPPFIQESPFIGILPFTPEGPETAVAPGPRTKPLHQQQGLKTPRRGSHSLWVHRKIFRGLMFNTLYLLYFHFCEIVFRRYLFHCILQIWFLKALRTILAGLIQFLPNNCPPDSLVNSGLV